MTAPIPRNKHRSLRTQRRREESRRRRRGEAQRGEGSARAGSALFVNREEADTQGEQ
jgi:hypothetical protein